MSFALPTVLMLTKKHGRMPAVATDEPVTDDAGSLPARLAEALLGDAALTLADLPGGWCQAAPGEESLFTATEYEGIVLAGLRTAFDEETTGGAIDHEVGVLPRWMLRDLPSDDNDHTGVNTVHELTRLDGTAHSGIAVALPPVAVDDGAAQRTIIRRGAVVMALGFGGVSHTTMAAATAAATAKCEQIAEVLR